VNIDGKLDDEAWTEIPYSETFMGKIFVKSTFGWRKALLSSLI
jgi:hypothetical protein